MLNTPFSPWPSFTQEESDAASRVLLSNKVNYWTGNEGREFEKEFAHFAGTNHAIALANGTLALDLALYGLKIGERNGGSKEDEVLVTSRSFIASASCVVNAGARPVFVDVGRDSQNVEAATLTPAITKNTRAVICVHLAGWPCDMDAIRNAIGGADIALIEDCAQAHGAQYKGRPVGGLGDVAAWSFCQDKIMTTGGEGGMVTCNDHALWERMWSFKDHGKNWDAIYNRSHAPGFRWIHEEIGTNWRLTELQSAIGRVQLKRMPEWTASRTRNANALAQAFTDNGIFRLPYPYGQNSQAEGTQHGWYKFYAFVRPEALSKGWSRDRIVEEIQARSVPCLHGTCAEIYLEKAFDGLDLRPASRLKTSRELGEDSIMFMVHPTLTQEEIARTVDVVRAVSELASR